MDIHLAVQKVEERFDYEDNDLSTEAWNTIRAFISGRVETLHAAELATTDSQQLKAAIALVRQHANVLHEAGAYSLNSFLDVIERRAAV